MSPGAIWNIEAAEASPKAVRCKSRKFCDSDTSPGFCGGSVLQKSDTKPSPAHGGGTGGSGFTESIRSSVIDGANRPRLSVEPEPAMDFPISDLMDQGACYDKLVNWLHPVVRP
jgi:hypothetical protein